MNEFKIALCQMGALFEKEQSFEKARSMIMEAAEKGTKIIALPEMWNCPYDNTYFRAYSEVEGGPSFKFLENIARETSTYIIGGSVPELFTNENGQEHIYNTCYCFSPRGSLIGKHRKVHLFDIDVYGKIRFMESEVLSPGNSSTVIDTEFCKIGIAICYDVRFPELSRKMVNEGAKLIFIPGAFNMTTGPAHWDLTMRARALDNQVYFAGVSQSRNLDFSYHAFGNSCIASPWGDFIAHMDEKEGILFGDINLDYVDSIRDQLPLIKHLRPEVY